MKSEYDNWMARPEGGEPLRDARLASLLLAVEPSAAQLRGILPFERLERLVQSAPPVRVGLMQRMLVATARPWRFAAAALSLAVLSSTTLAVMPAQSDQLGTVVLAEIPTGWQAGGEELREVEAAAEGLFEAADFNSQAELYCLTLRPVANEANPKLALAFINVDNAAAQSIFGTLAAKYPALRTADPEFRDIQSKVFENRLQEMLGGLRDSGRYRGLGEAQIRSEVVKELHAAGLAPSAVTVTRMEDGGMRIEFSASMDIEVSGHLQESLGQIGLSRELLGDEAYAQIEQALEAH